MRWSYRVMVIEQPVVPGQSETELHFFINDVYYNEEGAPDSCGKAYEAPDFRKGEVPSGDSPSEIGQCIRLMLVALDKPVLWYGNRFPEEYIPQ